MKTNFQFCISLLITTDRVGLHSAHCHNYATSTKKNLFFRKMPDNFKRFLKNFWRVSKFTKYSKKLLRKFLNFSKYFEDFPKTSNNFQKVFAHFFDNIPTFLKTFRTLPNWLYLSYLCKTFTNQAANQKLVYFVAVV